MLVLCARKRGMERSSQTFGQRDHRVERDGGRSERVRKRFRAHFHLVEEQ